MPLTTDCLAARPHALTATEIVHAIAAGKATCEMIAQACRPASFCLSQCRCSLDPTVCPLAHHSLASGTRIAPSLWRRTGCASTWR